MRLLGSSAQWQRCLEAENPPKPARRSFLRMGPYSVPRIPLKFVKGFNIISNVTVLSACLKVRALLEEYLARRLPLRLGLLSGLH